MRRPFRPTFKPFALSTVAIAALVALPYAANAQSAAPAAAEPTTAGEPGGDIVVTARNRAESIEKVPLSITAFSAKTMEQKSIQGLDDLARFTPGFSFESFSGGFATPIIRGQAQTSVTALESNVSTFYDGIYMPRSWSVDTGTASLDRVEVVKGPQSSRYGRNAFAGAVNYIPFKASTSSGFTAEASGTVGSDARYDYGIKANIPLGKRFAIAGNYNYSTYDGSWTNSSPYANVDVNPGTTGKIGGWKDKAYSVSAKANPIDPWIIELSYTGFDNNRESNPNMSLIESTGALNCGTVRSGHYSLYCGTLPNNPGSISADPRSYGAVTSSRIFRAYSSLKLAQGLTASYLFGRVTGNVDIANLTVANNANCGATCTFQNAPVGNIAYSSHEARLTYDSHSWHFAAGGFVSDGYDNYNFNLVIAPNITNAANVQPLSSTTGAVTIPLTRTKTSTRVHSGFAEAQWTSPDGATRIGAEGRYSSTRVQALNLATNVAYEQTFNIFTPRVTVEHDIAQHSMLYASAAEGSKTGGFNPTAVNVSDRYFGPEKNWTYELGSKNTFMDGMLTLNGDVFYTRWTGIQINSPDSGSSDPNAVNITLNLGDANVYGVEFDGAFVPNRHWSFDANFSYSDARYSDGTKDARFSRTVSPCNNVVCPSNGSIDGNTVERTPPLKGAFGAQWQTDLPWKKGNFFVRGDLTWQSKFYDTPMNLGTIPQRTLVNFRTGITWRTADLSFWMKNAFDKSYVSNAYVVILPSGNSYQLFYGQRRSFGATLKIRYR